MRFGIFLILAAAVLLAESTAGLKWTAPAGWTSKGSAPMRAATYTVQDAECVVYFFGQGQGGSVDANIQRWSGQFTENGAPAQAKVAKRTVHALPVTTIDVTGAYSGMEGGSQTGVRMLAAIIENPAGNIFLKFTGPAKTIAANQQKFEQMLASFQKE